MAPSSIVHFSLPTGFQPVRSVPLNRLTQSSPGAFGPEAFRCCPYRTIPRARARNTKRFMVSPRLERIAPFGTSRALCHPEGMGAVIPFLVLAVKILGFWWENPLPRQAVPQGLTSLRAADCGV